jgi:hypothetical protein
MFFSKAQKRQIDQAGQTLIQIASGDEIATYDTLQRRQTLWRHGRPPAGVRQAHEKMGPAAEKPTP